MPQPQTRTERVLTDDGDVVEFSTQRIDPRAEQEKARKARELRRQQQQQQTE
jgi:hypothetical protein